MNNNHFMLLIIGNGFDINIGLKTRYSDFMRSISPLNDIFYDSNLFQYLLEKFNQSANQDELRWIDLENELRTYCKSFINSHHPNNKVGFTFKSIDQLSTEYDKTVFNYALKHSIDYQKFVSSFKKDYQKLVEKLQFYLKIEITESVNKSSQAYLLLMNLTSKFFQKWEVNNQRHCSSIINFNYTTKSILRKIIEDEINTKSAEIEKIRSASGVQTIFTADFKYYQIHGSLEEENIILGIEGKSNLPEEFSFLKKGFNPNYSRNCNIEKLIKENDTIVFFGFSFGETDSPYFRQFLGSYNDSIDIYTPADKQGFADKKIIIFYWGESGYYQLTNRINALTEGNLDRFRQYNNVEFVDLQTFRPTSYKDYDKFF